LLLNESAAPATEIDAVKVVTVEEDESVFTEVTLQLVGPKLNEYEESLVAAVLPPVKNGERRSGGEPVPKLYAPI
jgi:hypothetical protein